MSQKDQEQRYDKNTIGIHLLYQTYKLSMKWLKVILDQICMQLYHIIRRMLSKYIQIEITIKIKI